MLGLLGGLGRVRRGGMGGVMVVGEGKGEEEVQEEEEEEEGALAEEEGEEGVEVGEGGSRIVVSDWREWWQWMDEVIVLGCDCLAWGCVEGTGTTKHG